IQEAYDLAGTAGDTGIESRCLAAVLFQDRNDVRLVSGDDPLRTIARSIVDDDDLGWLIALRQGAVDRLRQVPSIVYIVDEDADERLHRACDSVGIASMIFLALIAARHSAICSLRFMPRVVARCLTSASMLRSEKGDLGTIPSHLYANRALEMSVPSLIFAK